MHHRLRPRGRQHGTRPDPRPAVRRARAPRHVRERHVPRHRLLHVALVPPRRARVPAVLVHRDGAPGRRLRGPAGVGRPRAAGLRGPAWVAHDLRHRGHRHHRPGHPGPFLADGWTPDGSVADAPGARACGRSTALGAIRDEGGLGQDEPCQSAQGADQPCDARDRSLVLYEFAHCPGTVVLPPHDRGDYLPERIRRAPTTLHGATVRGWCGHDVGFIGCLLVAGQAEHHPDCERAAGPRRVRALYIHLGSKYPLWVGVPGRKYLLCSRQYDECSGQRQRRLRHLEIRGDGSKCDGWGVWREYPFTYLPILLLPLLFLSLFRVFYVAQANLSVHQGILSTWAFLPFDGPYYRIGNGINLATTSIWLSIGLGLWAWMRLDNRRRSSLKAEGMLDGLSQEEIQNLDWKHPRFRWKS